MKDILKIAAILFIVCGLAAGGLSFVNLATKDRIAAFAEEERVAAFKKIFPAAESFNERSPAEADGAVTEWDAVAGGVTLGRVQLLKPLGYSGAIRLVYGVDVSGALTGVQVLEHTETPGLGAKITTAWIDQFKGKTRDEVALKKDGGAIDAIAAATISSRAVTWAVHDAMSGGFLKMEMKTTTPVFQELTKGLFRENPVLIIMLGLCGGLAASSNGLDGAGMGAAFTFVMICSNVVVSLIRKITPSQIRIPVFITVISTFVTIVDYAMKAYVPALSRSLGVFVPLIVVNCIVMGRAEAFASKNGVLRSLMDGIGMSIGFGVVITLMGVIREFLGAGTLFNRPVLGAGFTPILVFILPPGAFLVLGFLIAAQKRIAHAREAKT